MVGPYKMSGLFYFSLDVNIAQERYVKRLKAKYGIAGFGLLILLWARIYKNGFYLPWNEEEMYMFAEDEGVDAEFLQKVVKECFELGIFDKELYMKHGILTSKSIQLLYFSAFAKKQNPPSMLVSPEYLLVDPRNYIKNGKKQNPWYRKAMS